MYRIPRRQIALLATFLIGPLAHATDFDVKKHLTTVPDDATLVLFVPSMNELASGLAAFGKSAKLDMLKGIDGAKLLDTMNFPYPVDGVDTAGPMMLAGKEEDPEPVIVITLKDAAAWKKAVDAEDASDGMLKFKGEHEGWARIKDNVCIIAQEKEQLVDATKSTGKFASRFAKLKLSDKTACAVFIDVPGWKTPVNEGIDSFMALAEMGMAQAGGKEGEMAQAAMKTMMDFLKSVVAQTETFVVAARFDADGAHTDFITSFSDAGSVGEYLTKVEKTDANPLRGLPDKSWVATFGCEWKGGGNTSVLEQMGRTMMKSMTSDLSEDDKKKIDEGLKKQSEMMRHVTGMNFAMAADDGKLTIVCHYLAKNSEEVFKLFADATRLTAPTMSMIGGMSLKSTITDEKIGDKPAIANRMAIDENSPQHEMIEKVYGKDLTMFAVPTSDGVAFAIAGESSARKAATALAESKPGADSANANAQKILSTLTARPQGVLILNVDEMIAMGTLFARNAGVPVPQMKKVNAGSAAGGLYLEKDAVRIELSVPAQVVRAIVELAGGDEPAGGAMEQ